MTGPRPARPCPCGTGRAYAACCGPVLAGAAAGTAEQLMRSRYTAFAVGDADHLLATWAGATRPARLDLDAALRWERLEVLSAQGGLFDAEGTVEFRAHWRRGAQRGVLHERSRFVREDGRWRYLGG